MEPACIRCGSNAQLTARAIVTWRRRDEGEPEMRLVHVATCEPCRTNLRKLRDARNFAVAPTPPSWRRFRAWDVTGTLLVLALAYAVAAAAGWVGTWSLWIAAALAVAAIPANLLARRLIEAREEGALERYRATEEGRAYEAEERRMREAWRRSAAEIERETGFTTEQACDEGVLRSLDDRSLVDPDVWSPRRDGAVPYVLVLSDGRVEPRELRPPRRR